MKKIFLILFVILFIFISCKKTENKELNQNVYSEDIFSPALKREILKMIEIKNKEDKNAKSKFCSVVVLQNKDGKCILLISLGHNMVVKNMIQFTPPSDSANMYTNSKIMNGYTFLGSEFISCNIVSDFCSNNLIKISKLTPFKDSIPNYIKYDSEFVPTRIYEIINADSLRLIESSFITPD